MTLAALIVDDQRSFRDSARVLLEAGGIRVAGEAADGASGLSAARVLRPDVILLDIQLPDMSGFNVARELARDANAPAVVLISTRAAEDYGPRLRRVPARGFITKSELTLDAITALIGRAS